MCGIAGIVSRRPVDPAVIERMVARLEHRGPDAQGVWRDEEAQLGHTRLSILDLSPTGAQPMHDGDRVIVYNGEVYNFRQLRETLPGPFVSSGDTEVVLRAFRERGAAAVVELRGLFAFAVWDRATRTLTLTRDHLGIKPLYYRPLDDGIAFASEIEPLLELGRPPIDPGALRDYLTYAYVPTPKTPWEGIYKLPPAHLLTYRAGEISLERYWRLEPRRLEMAPDQASAEAERLIRRAITEASVSDVPLGLFLSGGVDSATLACLNPDPILSFTLGQAEKHRDESGPARRLAEHLGTTHRELTAHVPDLDETLETFVSVFGEPFGDSAALSMWLLSRFVGEHVKVALSGEGGDELFLGYRWHGRAMLEPPSRSAALAAALAPPLTRLGRSAQRRSASGLDRYASFLGTFTPRQVRALAGPTLDGGSAEEDPLWYYRAAWREDLPLQKRIQYADLHTYLPDDLLTKVDRAAMAWSLEVRPPLLDPRLVEFAVSLDPALHRDPASDRGKQLIQRALSDKMPPGHLERPKRGFNLPIARWVRKHPQTLRSALDRLHREGFIRRSRGLGLSNEQTWSLLVLDRWLSRHWRGYR